MVQVNSEDLIKALKRFKGLAKQDLLSSELTPDPAFWRTHAEARRTEYKRLIEIIKDSGVENACVYAFHTYESLPTIDETMNLPEYKGREQALELFFQILGVGPIQLRSARSGHSALNFATELSQQRM
ncbi:MAG TPA: hypothetical protein GXZ36_06220 [Firmicutes bacterium]|jgi:hypothetical protein|nr:hypothetical protein [Bacillota bacterium]